MSAVSPTDLALSCKKTYSTSNRGDVFASTTPLVHA